MITREILIAARALIDAPEKWTQGAASKDSMGRRVGPRSRDAVCFCALGAIDHVIGNMNCSNYGVVGLLLQIIPTSVSTFNDTHTHAEVLAMFDEAIARLDRGEV